MRKPSFPRLALLAAMATIGSAAIALADASRSADSAAERIARGKYLVTVGACNDCHTPWKEGPKGPELDLSRMLSGHPGDMVLPSAPRLDAPWMVAVAATNTAWSGPWGVSFTANLTPDPQTGLGAWTLENFRDTLRTGRHMGRGRPVLPPMPIEMYRHFTDADIESIFAYLRSIPPVKNRVPEPLPPATTPATASAPRTP